MKYTSYCPGVSLMRFVFQYFWYISLLRFVLSPFVCCLVMIEKYNDVAGCVLRLVLLPFVCCVLIEQSSAVSLLESGEQRYMKATIINSTTLQSTVKTGHSKRTYVCVCVFVCARVCGCMLYRELAPRRQQFHVAPAMPAL